MRCYLCHGEKLTQVHGRCRDSATTKVLRCGSCGLVFLDNIGEVTEHFYETSGMYEFQAIDRMKLMREEKMDTERRATMLSPLVKGKRVLDFGCGTGAVAAAMKEAGADVCVVELNQAQREGISKDWGIKAVREVKDLDGSFDLITLFHVLEHLPDPVATLKELKAKLSAGGKILVEVPHAEDALVALYDSAPFKDFTYWSLHLYLFNEATLKAVFTKAGFTGVEVDYLQRYNLSNHLHWLAKGKPGGHEVWKHLSSAELDLSYARKLADLKLTDTLIATSSA